MPVCKCATYLPTYLPNPVFCGCGTGKIGNLRNTLINTAFASCMSRVFFFLTWWWMVFFSNNILKKNLIIYNRNYIDILLNRW